MEAPPKGSQRVVLVTGPSGAGRSTAINALEDFGYEAIDNIPLGLIPRLLDPSPSSRPLALGVDTRNRDFSVQGLLELHSALTAAPNVATQLLFLDASPDVLARRYSETRRRHPMAPNASYTEGIALEAALMEEARSAADILIDTSDLSPHDLRAQMSDWFGDAIDQGLAVSLHSFSYKRGLPQGVDMVFDCRFLDNPHWVPALKHLTGLDPKVAAHVARDKRFPDFISKLTDLALFVLPACQDEGKAHFSFGFGCTGGQHRSVTVAQSVASTLADHGWRVSIRHRELDRRRLAPQGRDVTDKGART